MTKGFASVQAVDKQEPRVVVISVCDSVWRVV